jgi:predicted ATPase/class 3 adenylate cyclase
MRELPSGTVTFLFTDIEGSTRLWEEHPQAMQDALARHDDIVRNAIESHAGHVVKTTGDGFHAAFATACDAVDAASSAQVHLRQGEWADTGLMRVRMGLDSGAAEIRDGDYYGSVLNRAARLMSVAHGGQVVVSAACRELLDGSDVVLVDLGEHRLRDLTRPVHVFQVVHDELPREFPPLRSLDSFPGNLPVQVTGFVGRDREVREVAKEIVDTRLVTLTGVGGVGKTRLALQAAAEVLPSFRDGVWFVELAGVGRAEAVEDAVASALGYSGNPALGGAGGVIEFLRSAQLLVILDNCEHLLAPVADFVAEVLRSAPGVHVLATSREGIGVAGEHLRAVPSLGLPGPSGDDAAVAAADSVRLFVERASEASAGYELAPQDAHVIANLCRRLDGIPLAIELAAARVPALTPTEITSHLDRRFRLLTAGRRSSISRHQTLRSAIEWSYQLLDDEERSVFDRLSAFAGGFDLAAAQAIAATESIDEIDVIDVLARLVAKSLVVAEPRGGATRYRLLETVRDFGWEQLQVSGETDAVARRHARHFAAVARDAGLGLRGPDEAAWRERVQREVDNLRAALSWAIATGDVRLALDPVADLAILGDGVAPYGRLAEDAARLAPEEPRAAIALGAAAFAAVLQGEIDVARRVGGEARRMAEALDRTPDSLWVRCRVANATCVMFGYGGDEDAVAFGQAWIADARKLADPWCLGEALTFWVGGGLEDAVAAGEEALEIARLLGAPSRVAFAAIMLAARVAARDPARADELVREADRAANASGNDWVAYVTSMALVALHLARNHRRAAAVVALAWVQRAFDDRVPGHLVQSIATLAAVLLPIGDDTAFVLIAWAEHRGLQVIGSESLAGVGLTGEDELAAYRAPRTTAELERFAELARQLGDAGIVGLARECVDRLPADAR